MCRVSKQKVRNLRHIYSWYTNMAQVLGFSNKSIIVTGNGTCGFKDQPRTRQRANVNHAKTFVRKTLQYKVRTDRNGDL